MTNNEKLEKEWINIKNEIKELSAYLYANPEIGGFEVKSSAKLIESLESHGFTSGCRTCLWT